MIDALALTQALIRCPSVTPADAGALAVLEAALRPLGFECHRLRFEQAGTAPIENLYARIGKGAPHFCFAGHSDVVPPGEGWAHDPFAAIVSELSEDGTVTIRYRDSMQQERIPLSEVKNLVLGKIS